MYRNPSHVDQDYFRRFCFSGHFLSRPNPSPSPAPVDSSFALDDPSTPNPTEEQVTYHGSSMMTINSTVILGKKTLNETSTLVNLPVKGRGCSEIKDIRSCHNFGLKDCSVVLKNISRGSHHISTNKCQCGLKEYIPDDDEYRSSRNIAISLFRRYRNCVERGGGDNLKEFISAGVNAYALGCTEEGLRRELKDMKESGYEIDFTTTQTIGRGSTSLKSKIFSKEIDECILWLSIIFITILCTPQPTIVRWSSIPSVSDEKLVQWKGFCAIIANAYFMRGMAWLPVKTLQLEQMAVVGNAEAPSVVASRMRLVFSTLEVVSPQWPKV